MKKLKLLSSFCLSLHFCAPGLSQSSEQRAYELKIDSLYGNTRATSQSAFDPSISPNHSCKRMAGPTTAVQVWMCVVEKGNVISMTGDLLAVALATDGKNWSVDLRCSSIFKPATEFTTKTFKTFGALRITPSKSFDYLIIEPQLGPGSRITWRDASTNECSWAATEINTPNLGPDILRAICRRADGSAC